MTIKTAEEFPFAAGTGLMGATDSGQRVTDANAHLLPAGSVVRLDGTGRLIRLHDDLWLWCADVGWCYDRLERHLWRLPGTLCHIPVTTDYDRGLRAGLLRAATLTRDHDCACGDVCDPCLDALAGRIEREAAP